MSKWTASIVWNTCGMHDWHPITNGRFLDKCKHSVQAWRVFYLFLKTSSPGSSRYQRRRREKTDNRVDNEKARPIDRMGKLWCHVIYCLLGSVLSSLVVEQNRSQLNVSHRKRTISMTFNSVRLLEIRRKVLWCLIMSRVRGSEACSLLKLYA